MVIFNKEDFEIWSNFRNVKKNTLNPIEFDLICRLHSEYYNHKFTKPCTCSPRTIKNWIKELNIIWENGN